VDLTIGKLAKAAGVGVETIRFYERRGLVRKPPKRDGAFRFYPADEATRIRFVKRAQELGFTLREVKELLDLHSGRKITGAQVEAKAQAKVKQVRQKIEDLTQMEASLLRLAKVCGSGRQAVSECKVFDCFETGCRPK
jgi:MerR family transcriptional regulator, mercuric resistance operon regulatory protein